MKYLLTLVIVVIILVFYIGSREFFLKEIRLKDKKNENLKKKITELEEKIRSLKKEKAKLNEDLREKNKKKKTLSDISVAKNQERKDDLGSFIKRKRMEKNISVRELGKLVDISAPYISLIENDRTDKVLPRDLVINIGEKLELTESSTKKLKRKYFTYKQNKEKKIIENNLKKSMITIEKINS